MFVCGPLDEHVSKVQVIEHIQTKLLDKHLPFYYVCAPVIKVQAAVIIILRTERCIW